MLVDLIYILILSSLAGLATGIGGLIGLIKKPGRRLFGFLAGFATGVMVVLSFLGLMKEAWELAGLLTAILGFSVGSFFMFFLDSFIPHKFLSIKERGIIDHRFLKIGILVAIGVTLHNIPEGISVGAGYLHLPAFGMFVALAIALHNMPEGIIIALPLYKSGVSRLNAFKIALLSGLVEPIGAIVAALFLGIFRHLIHAALAFAAGVMVFITLDELIPIAYERGHEHFTALGIISGAISGLILLGGFVL